MKKAPCVDVRTDVHKDMRFEVLGELAGYNRYEALGRMHALWSWCVDRGLQDAPEDSDGYVVPEAVVRRFLGPNGIAAILGDGCDDFALGERREGGRVYLRGTSEYVAERRARAAVSSAGGAARAAAAAEHRDQGGRFVSGNTNVQPEPSRTPAVEPAASQLSPASSSSSSPSDLQNSPAPRAIPLPERRSLGDRTWDRVNAVRAELAAANGWTDVHPLHPMDPGRSELAARILECGAEAEARVEHVLAVAFAEARTKNQVEFLSGSMFELRSWRKKLAMRVQDAARPRAGPRRAEGGAIGAAAPRSDHPDDPIPRRFGEL